MASHFSDHELLKEFVSQNPNLQSSYLLFKRAKRRELNRGIPAAALAADSDDASQRPPTPPPVHYGQPASPSPSPVQATATAIPTSNNFNLLTVEEMPEFESDDMDTSQLPLSGEPADSDDDGFTVVAGKKRSQTSAPKAEPAPKVVKAKNGTAVKAPSQPDSSAASTGKKGKPPPPVVIRDPKHWESVSRALNEQRVNYTRAQSKHDGVHVNVPTMPDYQALTRILNARNYPWHSFALPEDKKLRVVIKSIPTDTSTEYVKETLLAQSVPVLEVHRMYGKGKRQFNMVLCIIENTPEGKGIFKVKHVAGLTSFKVEAPHKRGMAGQCHNCQQYGHSARNCHAHPACVKCLEPHGTKDCTRVKTVETESQVACVLCGQTGHPANWRGCTKAPKKRNAWGKSRSQPAPVRSQAPPPLLSSQAAFPPLRQSQSGPCPPPAPAPTRDIPPLIPPPRPSPRPLMSHASPQPRYNASFQSGVPSFDKGDFDFASQVCHLISYEDLLQIAELGRALKAVGPGNPFGFAQVMGNYAAVVAKLHTASAALFSGP